MTDVLDRVAELLEQEGSPAFLAGVQDWRNSSCVDPEHYPSRKIAPNWEGPGTLCHSCSVCRPEQRAPIGDWDVWLYLAGRGSGKTRSAPELVAEALALNFRWRIAIVAPTYADARDTCVEGESGILSVFDRWGWTEGREYIWNRSLGELIVASTKSRIKLFSAEKPARLRGPQHHMAWVDELAQVVRDAPDAWDMLLFGLRLGRRPQVVATTTPLPVQVIKDLMVDPTCAVTRGKTMDNAANLAPPAMRALQRKYAGTRLGRQELDAEILDDVPTALWRRDWIETKRVAVDWAAKWAEDDPEVTRPVAAAILQHLAGMGIHLARIVVGLDPAVESKEGNDQSGIIVVGRATNRRFYVLADYTLRDVPDKVMAKVIQAVDDWQANSVIIEVNNGGQYIPAMLRATCLITGHSFIDAQTVRAKAGQTKRVRAEPVSALYGQGQVHHVGTHVHLEDCLCVWEPSKPESPDRMDALVYGVLHLEGGGETVIANTSKIPRIPRHQMGRAGGAFGALARRR